MDGVRLKDITWGGRIRVQYQGHIWGIAEKASERYGFGFGSGGSFAAVSFSERFCFLDGGVYSRHGYWADPSCGMFWHGTLAKAYILYKLGLDPKVLLNRKRIPPFEELEHRVVRAQKVARKRARLVKRWKRALKAFEKSPAFTSACARAEQAGFRWSTNDGEESRTYCFSGPGPRACFGKLAFQADGSTKPWLDQSITSEETTLCDEFADFLQREAPKCEELPQ